MAVANLLRGLPYLVDSYNAEMVCFHGTMQNRVFFLPVIYTQYDVLAFLAAQHTTVLVVLIHYIHIQPTRLHKA